jgi:valyl-tRNA synthetase
VNKAPEKLVRAEIDKKEQAKHKLEKLEDKLSKFH